MSKSANQLLELIDCLERQNAAEAYAVADLLQDLINGDDPSMTEPDVVVAVLNELIGWANNAKTRIERERSTS